MLLSCDNTPTVYWIRKRNSSTSMIAQELLKVLASRMAHAQFPPPQIHHIKGLENVLADYASRKFRMKLPDGSKTYLSDDQFLTKFNSKFPLQQKSWRLFRLNTNIVSRICAILLMKRSTMASWRQLTKKGNDFGTIGPPTATHITWTPASPTIAPMSTSPPWKRSPKELEMENFPAALASECKRFKSHYVQSARPSNWMG